jgi:DNA topoisomerase 2-associated protein PAT1
VRQQLPPPFSHAESLLIVERLFTNILDIEQLRRNRPPVEDDVAIEAWNQKLQGLLDQIWQGLRVSGPLYETYATMDSCMVHI